MLVPKYQESNVQEAVVTHFLQEAAPQFSSHIQVTWFMLLHESPLLAKEEPGLSRIPTLLPPVACHVHCPDSSPTQERLREHKIYGTERISHTKRNLGLAQILLFHLKQHLLLCVSNSPHPGKTKAAPLCPAH